MFHQGEPRAVQRHAAPAAVFVPDFPEGGGFQLLLEHHELGKIAAVLKGFFRFHRLEQGKQQGLLQVSEAGGPGRQAVDGGVEVVQGDVHPLRAAADNLPADFAGFVVEQHHMVAVPADGPGDVEGDLGEEGQQRRDLIAHHLGGVVVAVVHQGDALVPVEGGVGEGELRAAHSVRLHPDAKYLALNAGLHQLEVVGLGEDFVDGLAVTRPGLHAVAGDVLEAVPRPDVHHAGLAQLLRQVLGDADAGFPMVDPEAARLLVGGGQGQRVAFGVGEKGGVEVAAQAPRLAELHPGGEVLGLQRVPAGPLSGPEDGVAGVEVQLFQAGAQLQHHVQVGHQLLGGAGPAGVIPRGLDAAGEGGAGVGVEAPHVVPLPAVEGHGDGVQRLQCPVRVHA